jgi:two-component system OmpR family sensor kinase
VSGRGAGEGFRVWRPRPGLFLKLLAAFVIVVLVVGILVTWLTDRATRQEFRLYTTTIGQRQAERLAPLLTAYYLVAGSWEGVEGLLTAPQMGMMGWRPEGMMGRPGDTDMWHMLGNQVLIVDAKGEIVADSRDELIGAKVDAESLSAGAPIVAGGEQVGTVLVTVGALAEVDNNLFLRQVSRATVLATLVAGVIALALGAAITWGVTRPMRELTDATRAITAGDLSRRVRVEADDEIGDLARAFNQMAAELERAEALRRQMTADIAHELRTPLSVIQGNVEALQDGVFPLTLEALEPIQAKTELLGRLVEDLRNLALAEAGQLPLDRQPTDLARLAEGAVAAFQPAAEAKGIALELALASDLPLADADPQRVEQVLVNLLSNALRHTPAGGRVEIEMAPVPAGRLTVRITDTGPGIPLEALPNVFERFYRVDRGRGRGEGGDGTGLGLAVARSIVEAHGGVIKAENAPGRGASFWFTLPAALPR